MHALQTTRLFRTISSYSQDLMSDFFVQAFLHPFVNHSPHYDSRENVRRATVLNSGQRRVVRPVMGKKLFFTSRAYNNQLPVFKNSDLTAADIGRYPGLDLCEIVLIMQAN
jgi:hypothetical protein